ncbi:MAG TPA: ATP-binding cassette domain-containing protein, partial [Thermoanaerobaculia bacterium]
ELAGVTHTYRSQGEETFTLGPLDLALVPGELVFVVGGNGSGKTTLAKLLVGLYLPERGEIRVDGRPVTPATMDSYRQLFSAVFADFYLFEKLLGSTGVELDAAAQRQLERLRLEGRVGIREGRFSTLELSQGQRKRVALLVALLEDAPILVFDEWAADQEPEFRELFYRQLLGELRARGKTAVVITHDDRYYQVADRIVKLDCGRVVVDQRAAAWDPAAAAGLPSA